MKLVSKLLSTIAPLLMSTAAFADDCSINVTTWGGNYQRSYETVATEFEKQYNCKVEFIVGVNQDFIVKARAGEVDVLTAPILFAVGAEQEGLLLKLEDRLVPNVSNLYEKARHSPSIVWANVGDYALVYNSKYISEAPNSWDALWDEQYRNRVALWTFEGPVTLLLTVQQAEKHGGSFENIEPGLKRIADLINSGNVVAQSDAESQIVSLYESDEAWIGPLTTGRIKDLWDRGMSHIKLVRPQEGTFPVITALSVIKTTKNPEMAQKFVDFALGEFAQTTFAVNNLYAPTNKTVKLPEDFGFRDVLVQGESFDRLFLVDFLKLNKVRGQWQEQYLRMLK